MATVLQRMAVIQAGAASATEDADGNVEPISVGRARRRKRLVSALMVETATVQSRAPRLSLRPFTVASTKVGPATGVARLNPSSPLTGATCAMPCTRAQA